MAQILLERGANPLLTNQLGDSPLLLAVLQGHSEIVAALELSLPPRLFSHWFISIILLFL